MHTCTHTITQYLVVHIASFKHEFLPNILILDLMQNCNLRKWKRKYQKQANFHVIFQVLMCNFLSVFHVFRCSVIMADEKVCLQNSLCTVGNFTFNFFLL